MATTQNERDILLAATSPRIITIPLPTTSTVDLSNTSQTLNNLPSFNRVTGVTTIATQTTLANGGGFLTGFGGVSSQNTLANGGAFLTGFGAVSSQNTLTRTGGFLTGFGAVAGESSLAYGGAFLSGFGAVAPLSSIDLSTSFAVGNLAANRIAVGTLAAGVIYAGTIVGSQITANSITVDRLMSGAGALADPDFTFALNGSISTFLGTSAVGGATSSTAKPAAIFLHASSGVGFSLVSGTGSTNANAYAGVFAGNFNSLTGARACTAFLGSGSGVAGSFTHESSGNNAQLGNASYAIQITTGTFRYGGVTIQTPTGNPAHVLHGDGSWS